MSTINDAALTLREDYLRYEKDILRDWLRAEFSDLKNRTVG